MRSFILLAGVVSFFCLTFPAYAQRAPSGVFATRKANTFNVSVGVKTVSCARQKPRASHIPVRRVARNQAQPLAAHIKDLRASLAELERGSRQRKRRMTQIKNFVALNRQAKPLCAYGPRPRALDAVVAGHGIEPVAASLSVQAPVTSMEVTCEVVAIPDSVTLDSIQGCNILVSPKSHRVDNAQLQFVAITPQNGLRSTEATLSLTWSQNGSFIGDAHSMGKYKDSLTQPEAMHLIKTAALGANAAELVALATGPGGLDAVVNRLLTPNRSSACQAVEQQALAVANSSMGRTTFSTLGTTFTASPDSEETRTEWNTNAAAQYWLYLLRHSCDPLRERMGLLWHNHFAATLSAGDVATLDRGKSHAIKSHMDWLRSNVPEAGSSMFVRLDRLVAWMHGADLVMLNWLNNKNNFYSASGGNENYARELLELFTTGPRDPVTNAVNYTEQHIYDLRFAVMGYNDPLTIGDNRHQIEEVNACCYPGLPGTTNSNQLACAALPVEERCRMVPRYETQAKFYNARWNATNQPTGTFLFQGMPFGRYDVFKSNILGPSGDLGRSTHVVNGILQPSGRNLRPVFDSSEDNFTSYLMYEHPGVARFLAARLISTFASQELTESLVAPVAQALRANNFDPTEALRMILSSSAFFAAANQNDGVANPLLRFVTFLRIYNLPLDRFAVRNLVTQAQELASTSGFPIATMPTVFGISEQGKIIGNSVKDGRTFLATQQLIEGLKNATDYFNDLNTVITASQSSYSWESLLPGGDWANLEPAQRPTPEAVLQHIAAKASIELSEFQKRLLVEYLTTISTRSVDGEAEFDRDLRIPDQEHLYQLDWRDPTFTYTKMQAFWRLKAPGLLILLWGLDVNTLI